MAMIEDEPVKDLLWKYNLQLSLEENLDNKDLQDLLVELLAIQ